MAKAEGEKNYGHCWNLEERGVGTYKNKGRKEGRKEGSKEGRKEGREQGKKEGSKEGRKGRKEKT